MKHSRPGESLWLEWNGYGLQYVSHNEPLVLFTEGHVDTENDVVKRALASAIQRIGFYDSLGQSYSAVDREGTKTRLGHFGYVDGDIVPTVCDESGLTYGGETVESAIQATWVEIEDIYE